MVGAINSSELKMKGVAADVSRVRPDESSKGWHRVRSLMEDSYRCAQTDYGIVSPAKPNPGLLPSLEALEESEASRGYLKGQVALESPSQYAGDLTEVGILSEVYGVPVWSVARATECSDILVSYHDAPHGEMLPQSMDEITSMVLP